ncbi:MAG: GtrA family protein [Eubacteriales bacterium]|nr:GtrA family protein [Eubacteriales bacterium]
MKIKDKAREEAGTASRFVIVGIINTLLGCGMMFALYNLAGWGYWPSSLTNYVFVSILSYILNKKYTFRHRGDIGGSILRFAITIGVCYLLAYGIARPVMMNLLEGANQRVQENIAMFVGMVLFTVFNYLGQRLFAFRQSK